MAGSEAQIRRELEQERQALAEAVGALRGELDLGGRVRAKLPAVAAGALGVGFVLSGGVGAAARLLLRRGREGEPKAKLGRFSLIDRR